MRYATGHDRPPERAILGTLLGQAADLVAFSLTFLLGMVFLIARHALKPYEVAGAAMLLAMNVALCGALGLSLWKPAIVPGLLRRLPGIRRCVPARLEESLEEAATSFLAEPLRPTLALAAALSAHAVNVLSLLLVFVAFFQPVRFGPLVAGYGVGTLAWMFSPIPTGVGVVEGAMALVYASVGVPVARAVVVAIAYRGLNFWLPLLLGVLCLRHLSRVGRQEKQHDSVLRLK